MVLVLPDDTPSRFQIPGVFAGAPRPAVRIFAFLVALARSAIAWHMHGRHRQSPAACPLHWISQAGVLAHMHTLLGRGRCRWLEVPLWGCGSRVAFTPPAARSGSNCTSRCGHPNTSPPLPQRGGGRVWLSLPCVLDWPGRGRAAAAGGCRAQDQPLRSGKLVLPWPTAPSFAISMIQQAVAGANLCLT